MYSDPSQVRTNVVKVNLNDEEMKIVEAAAAKLGLQPAAYCREAVMKALAAILAADPQSPDK